MHSGTGSFDQTTPNDSRHESQEAFHPPAFLGKKRPNLQVSMKAPAPSTTRFLVDTPHLQAALSLRGYVSGVAASSLLDKKTGARDLGFGLEIADFLLEQIPQGSTPEPGQYEFGNAFHGNIAKRYVEGPQICTQAGLLPAVILQGTNFVAVKHHFRWTKAYTPHAQAGSLWQQTLIFPFNTRYFLAAEKVTTVSESESLVLRRHL